MPRRAAARLWFRDVRDGGWLGPNAATFVHSPSLRTPMAGGIVATAYSEEVERLVADANASVFATFEEMRAARSAPATRPVGAEGR